MSNQNNQPNNFNQQNTSKFNKSESTGNLNSSSTNRYGSRGRKNKWKNNNFYKGNYNKNTDSINNIGHIGLNIKNPTQNSNPNIVIQDDIKRIADGFGQVPNDHMINNQHANYTQPNVNIQSNQIPPGFASSFEPNFKFKPYFTPNPQMLSNFPYNPQPNYHLIPYYGYNNQIIPYRPRSFNQNYGYNISQSDNCCEEKSKSKDSNKDVNNLIKEYIGKIDEKIGELTKKEKMWLSFDINNLDDLIQVAKDFKVKYSPDYEYQLDLGLLSSMIPELESLNNMIGLKSVKNQIVDLILYYGLKLDNKNHDLLHTVIEGEPGTGKTELAEKLAKIYLKMGILTKDTFKKVRRSDLIAGYLGQTAIKTEKVLEECRGGVLFIDEAYSLGNAEGKDGRDSFSKECIDMLNQWLTENKSEFVCIIAGYKDDLSKSFFSYNTGLERRFPIRFSIDSYSDDELTKIFIKKIREFEWDIDCKNLTHTIKTNRKYFKFNGGDMEILFAKCKIAHSKNLLKEKEKIKKILTEKDIIDGLKIYLENPEVKKRGDVNPIFSSIYI